MNDHGFCWRTCLSGLQTRVHWSWLTDFLYCAKFAESPLLPGNCEQMTFDLEGLHSEVLWDNLPTIFNLQTQWPWALTSDEKISSKHWYCVRGHMPFIAESKWCCDKLTGELCWIRWLATVPSWTLEWMAPVTVGTWPAYQLGKLCHQWT